MITAPLLLCVFGHWAEEAQEEEEEEKNNLFLIKGGSGPRILS